MSSGVHLRPAEQLLISRARDFLAAGPSDPITLVAHICQLPSPPRSVAEHMAMALLSGWDEFHYGADGRWRLGSSEVPVLDVPALAAPAVPPVNAPAANAAAGSIPGSRAPAMVRHDALDELSYVVVDVETTGGRPFGGDRITEIAAVVVERGEITRVFETLVNPQRPIPPMITALTHISWEMVKDKPTFRDIVGDVAEVLRGNVFVAHNAMFDWRFVSSEIVRATGEQLAGRRLCTVRLARRLLPNLPRRSLDHLARYYGIEIAARHRAAGDAVATARCLIRLLAEAGGRGCATWAELDSLLSAPSAPRRRGRRSAMPRPIDRDTTA